jgi:hypothetical protein
MRDERHAVHLSVRQTTIRNLSVALGANDRLAVDGKSVNDGTPVEKWWTGGRREVMDGK